MRPELEKKVNFAIKLLQSIPTDEGPIEVAYGGGKDSDIILELAKMAGINYRAIYKNTTIDCPGTIAHAKEKGVEIMQPKKTFSQLLEEMGYPSRWSRFCCGELKEYKILNRAIHGIRRAESTKRAERYKEPEYCRSYSKKDKVKVYLPILEWTDQDVEEFIEERGIKCHPHYYEDGGKFDVTKRVGCIGCPLQSRRKRILEFKKYPKMLKLWIKKRDIWYRNYRKQGKTKVFMNSIDAMAYQLYCDNMVDFKEKTYGMFGRFNWKEFFEKEFNIDLSDIYYGND